MTFTVVCHDGVHTFAPVFIILLHTQAPHMFRDEDGERNGRNKNKLSLSNRIHSVTETNHLSQIFSYHYLSDLLFSKLLCLKTKQVHYILRHYDTKFYLRRTMATLPVAVIYLCSLSLVGNKELRGKMVCSPGKFAVCPKMIEIQAILLKPFLYTAQKLYGMGLLHK